MLSGIVKCSKNLYAKIGTEKSLGEKSNADTALDDSFRAFKVPLL